MKSPSTISRTVKYGLHFVGIWPGTPFPGLHKFYWVIAMTVCLIYQYRYIIMHYKENMLDVVDSLSVTVTFTLLGIKLIVVWKNHGILCDILSTMEEDCQKYVVIDTNNLISKTSHLSFRLTSTIMSLYLASGVSYAVGVFTSQVGNDSSRQLILKMDLPFKTNESPVYELVVTTQLFHQVSGALAFGIFSALLLMVILHVGCHIDIMCRALMEAPLGDKKQLRFFISRHQEIIIFTERIEKLFTYLALSQLVSNTLITCFLGFLIISSINTGSGLPIIVKSLLFYVVICLEAFIYCFAGEYLNTKSKMITETAYEFLWYDLHPNDSRLLVILLLRSQKGFTFTFGKFSNLSLENFTAIMKASASYVSVLLAMS